MQPRICAAAERGKELPSTKRPLPSFPSQGPGGREAVGQRRRTFRPHRARNENRTLKRSCAIPAGGERVQSRRPFFAGDSPDRGDRAADARGSTEEDLGSPSMAGYPISADAWQCVLSRFLKDQMRLLDIGCGCGKMAEPLIYHPYIKRYIGFDVFKPSIAWAQESIVPLAGQRFEFHWIDVVSVYNPGGRFRGTEVIFPAGDGAIDLAYACSLFTHLFEEDASTYPPGSEAGAGPGWALPADDPH